MVYNQKEAYVIEGTEEDPFHQALRGIKILIQLNKEFPMPFRYAGPLSKEMIERGILNSDFTPGTKATEYVDLYSEIERKYQESKNLSPSKN